MDTSKLDEKRLAKYFDHTLLFAYSSEQDFEAFVKEAIDMDVKMLAINSCQVKRCKHLLGDNEKNIHVGAAIGFPLGQTTIEVKAFETLKSIEDGCDEIDYVINIGKLKDKDYDYIKKEMQTIVDLCREHNVISKVIFENCYLEKDEIKKMSLLAKEVKPDFIKTSTGFGTGGATLEDVKIMLDAVAGEVKVKAAGGIRDWETCKAMIELGVERIGTRSSAAILEGFRKERNS
ncbi:deoxyribose-phosphate aldolase [Breznakia sp. PF5-3]|uniref:deoxyribose-phosphate aldolase n=1 Tax=unclassified Breznakia TaxID=2623764 RepID=UPI002404DDE6|nr:MULTISPECIES: deoxyribose-phosphate aldolase [unclassified Breznakia]MDF9823802.1 deoxyribose-phosphate aldolase [Breznakia sp. PM6-1]MDF9834632.1 deoxyribose-phosphate aldolase [Breznakia sp. PF5-3]MDF9836751.1 deoxyribose-phosphate aldolase [Breznakia sp. PFB2-8]MDF9858800.1 deoxyribose-phosphate aldolase [Breznakia sp. PH5-24]